VHACAISPERGYGGLSRSNVERILARPVPAPGRPVTPSSLETLLVLLGDLGVAAALLYLLLRPAGR
jgi:hypothetical protein